MTPGGFKITDAPNPSWTYGEKVGATLQGQEWLEGEKSGWKTVDPATEDPRSVLSSSRDVDQEDSWIPFGSKLYGLLISGIAPRPVAFVSTISEDGITNLAPYSWFNQVSSNPPVLSVSITTLRNPTRPKDSARNIKATKEFTVNIISEPWVAQSNIASVNAPEDFDEWPVSGLTKEPSIHVKAPRVRESAFSMECELLQAIDIPIPETGEIGTNLILGRIKCIHVRNDVLDERGNVDPGKLKLVARMGGTLYAKVNEGYNISRPNWKEHGGPIRETTDAIIKSEL